jgi:hypothetical protein
MLNLFKSILQTLLLVALTVPVALASKIEKSERLVNLHDLKTTVAIGDYYLKQEALLAARAYLYQAGAEQHLGPDWNPKDAYWQQAESMLVGSVIRQTQREFSSMEWLSDEWTQLNDRDFSEQDMDYLLGQLTTDIGRKQVMITDHSVAFHVMASLSMAGKIQESVPGTELERKRMQDLFNHEDMAMRFDHTANPEGNQFAFSPVGKRYFVNAVLKISGLISRRLYQMAAAMPQSVAAHGGQAQSAIDAFRRARGG